MKANIHPTTHTITAQCVCGNTFQTISTQDSIQVDICAACHPFFTGDMRFVDREGRVDRFRKQMERAQKLAGKKPAKKSDDSSAAAGNDPKSYKDVLEEQKQAL